MIRKWPAKHGRELHPKPKLLVTAEAYLYATFGPKISDFRCPLGSVHGLWWYLSREMVTVINKFKCDFTIYLTPLWSQSETWVMVWKFINNLQFSSNGPCQELMVFTQGSSFTFDSIATSPPYYTRVLIYNLYVTLSSNTKIWIFSFRKNKI